ncbi:MAG: hypothetical protein VX205_16315 [Pseudomonadota bacterium]|nr:hypothetical protein [Sphingobium sp.]MCC4253573.1 hypothetical protein [Sphingobium naphthae]MEC7933201.1 hypothetical protein [Pseudomonadota bacterium]MEC8036553.1 hypothetical protein [Pseudomonadota bacterium]
MLYRNFAIATLVAAPLIVLAVQNFMPPAPSDPQGAADAPHPDAAPPPVVAPTVAPPAPPAPPPPADFANPLPAAGQPLPEAGMPMLAPGQGLPQAPAAPNGGANPYTSPQQAPAGSPNAEY